MNPPLNVFSNPISINNLIDKIKESNYSVFTFLDSGSRIDTFPPFERN